MARLSVSGSLDMNPWSFAVVAFAFAGCAEVHADGGLPHPWATLPLMQDGGALAGGTVVTATPTRLVVRYDRDDSLTGLATAWTDALAQAGWRVQREVPQPGLTARILARSRSRMSFAAGHEEGAPFVWLETLDGGSPTPRVSR